MKPKITIGTRSSKLALWQAINVKEELQKHYPDLEINLKEIRTKGDHITDVALSKVGGKGLFTKEIEDELLKGEIDLAAHSLKDLPTKLPDGLKIGAILKREDPHDVFICKASDKLKLPSVVSLTGSDLLASLDASRSGPDKPDKSSQCNSLDKLLPGSRIGTSSLRRIAQLKAIRPDLEYIDLRGNLDTRIRKLEEGHYDAIVLAYAGVKRLGFHTLITEHFRPTEILPAVGQGALAIEIRENDKEIEKLISKLNHNETFLISVCERSFLETLQGGCQIPIGAYSEIEDGKITLHGIIASLDGKKMVRDKKEGMLEINVCKKTGIDLAHRLLQNGGEAILQEIAPNRKKTEEIII